MKLNAGLNVEDDSSDEMPFIFGYPRFPIVAPFIVMLPLYGLWIWIVATTGRAWLRIMILLAVPYFLAVNMRSMLRLGETVIITQGGITSRTRFKRTHIPWQSVARVKPYSSLLERRCFSIEAADGRRITVSEALAGYDELHSQVIGFTSRHNPS